jgi:hypothetical protein
MRDSPARQTRTLTFLTGAKHKSSHWKRAPVGAASFISPRAEAVPNTAPGEVSHRVGIPAGVLCRHVAPALCRLYAARTTEDHALSASLGEELF